MRAARKNFPLVGLCEAQRSETDHIGHVFALIQSPLERGKCEIDVICANKPGCVVGRKAWVFATEKINTPQLLPVIAISSQLPLSSGDC